MDEMDEHLGPRYPGPHNDYDYFMDRGFGDLNVNERRLLLDAFRRLDNKKKEKAQKAPPKIPKISREPSLIEKTMMTSPVKSSKPLDGRGVNESTILVLEDGIRGIFKGVNGEAGHMRESIPAGTYYLREAAAYEVCRFLGWDYCPETVVREYNGEIGSFMKFAEGAEDGGYYIETSLKQEDIENMAFYNVIIGNEDRHGRNWMKKDGKPVAIDHGLAFHDVRNYGPALRSVFVSYLNNKEIPDRLIEKAKDLIDKRGELSSILTEYISPDEVESVFDRAQQMVDMGYFAYYEEWGGWD